MSAAVNQMTYLDVYSNVSGSAREMKAILYF